MCFSPVIWVRFVGWQFIWKRIKSSSSYSVFAIGARKVFQINKWEKELTWATSNEQRKKININKKGTKNQNEKKKELLERKLPRNTGHTFSQSTVDCTHTWSELQAGFWLAHIINFYFYLYVCFPYSLVSFLFSQLRFRLDREKKKKMHSKRFGLLR